MMKYFQERYALTEKGAKGLVKGIVFSALTNLSIMLPVLLIAYAVYEMLTPFMAGAEAQISISKYILMLVAILIVMFILHLIQYGAVYSQTYDQSAERRISLAEKLRKIPLSYFGSRDVSDIANTLMKDCNDLEFAFSHAIPQMLGGMISTVLTAIALLFLDWRLALCLLVVVPIAWLMIESSRKSVRKSDQKVYDTNRAVTEGMQECIESMKELKASNFEESYLKGLYLKLDQAEKASAKVEILRGLFTTGSQIVLKFGFALTILIGGILYANGQVALFTYLVFILMASRFYDPICAALLFLSAAMHADVRIDRLKEIENWPEHSGTEQCSPSNFDITFENVSFSYENGEKVLNNLSFTAKQGEVTALVGPSGSGKSTAAKLAARFWDIQSGRILLGDIDVSTVEEEVLLQHYSFVFQDVVLFDNTVMENIRVGRRGATDEEVIEAARLAQCHEFISELPQRYDTIIGENGTRLSGGERQRLSIARAILKNAPIILLDEATASVDVENETKIQKALTTLVKGKTVIIIAHRMRTIAGADHVVLLKDGELAEEGTPNELLKQNGLFTRMNKLQKESSDWAV